MPFRLEETRFGDLYVFSHDRDEAMTTFEEFCLQANGKTSDFLFRPISRWLLTGFKATLREDMDEGLMGVGKDCENGFWRIERPRPDEGLQEAKDEAS